MTRPDAMAEYGIASLSPLEAGKAPTDEGPTRAAARGLQGQAAQAGKTRNTPAARRAGGARARVGAGAGNPKTNKRLGDGIAEIASSPRREWPLALVLEKLGLKRSTFYYHLSHPGRDRYADVRPLVREAFSRTANGMGYRQVALALRNERGLRISGKTVLRLMREEGLRCRIRRRRYSSYRGDQGKAARNVLDRDFSSDAPMRKLVTDITEFHQPWGKAYLSPVMDLYNNEIVAWSVSERPNMAQINEMVAMLEPRLDGPALLHSDQGWQYQQRSYQLKLAELGIVQSMSRKATCLDNACMEGFFGHHEGRVLLLAAGGSNRSRRSRPSWKNT